MSDDHRCESSALVAPGVWKRCVRAKEHVEDHLWVEALNRSDGPPVMVVWPMVKQIDLEPATYTIHPGDVTLKTWAP